MTKNSSGYILVLALMLTSISVVLVTSVFYSSITHYGYARRFVVRQQAAVLASSGVEIAIARLNAVYKKKEQQPKQQKAEAADQKTEKGEAGQAPEPQNQRKARIGKLLGLLNRWQTFTLTQEREGIDGTLKVYIAAEQGKLNINKLFNFDQRAFIKQGKFEASALFKWIFGAMTRFTNNKDIFSAFASWLKNRKQPLDDVTELLQDKTLSVLNSITFAAPDEQKQVYLTDLFTLETDKLTIDPLFFSNSMATLLKFKRQPLKNMAEFIKKLPDQIDWQKEWDKILVPIYGKEYKAVPDQLKPLLSSQFEPTIFSVVSYATVGEVTQKMYAILQKDRTTNNYTIKKLYWI